MTRLQNLFDRRYYAAAQLATTGFTAQGTFVARPYPANEWRFPAPKRNVFLARCAEKAADWVEAEVMTRLQNFFDRRYDTAAQLATTGFTAQGTFVARPFPVNANGDFPLQSATLFWPGAPRSTWIGLRLKL
jgi:hypothetical protein